MITLRQKFQPPLTRTMLLPRSKLDTLIDQKIANGQSLLIAAPAGWGKTTTLSAWAASTRLDRSIHWYSPDPAECDPAVFFQSLLTAIAPHTSALHLDMQQMTTATGALVDSAEFVQQTINALVQHAQPVVLILDDFHVIEQQDAQGAQLCLALVEQLVLQTPLQVVILSRQMLRCYTSLVVRDRLIIVERQQLAFSSSDVEELAALRYQRSLESAQAEQLTQWACGWPAAIVLGLEHWTRTQVPQMLAFDAVLANVAESYLYPFLAEHIFELLPPNLQQFLLDTVVLEKLSVERCDELRETHDADHLLEDLRRRGLVVSTCNDWMRSFGLFRSFLLNRLKRDPARLQLLTRRAAAIHERAQQPDLAFRLLLSLPDIAAAAQLIRSYGLQLRQCGQHLTVQHWLGELQARGALPIDLYLVAAGVAMDLAEWSTVDAMLCLASVHGDLETRLEARLLEVGVACVRDNAQRAEEMLAQIDFAALPAKLHARGFEIAGRVALAKGATVEAIGHFRQSLVLMEPHANSGESPAPLYDLLGMATAMQGESVLASSYLQQADAIWRALGATTRRINTLNNLGSLALEDGRLHDACACYYAGLELADQQRRYRSQVLLLCGLAEVALIEGQGQLALQHYERALQIAREAQLASLQVLACAGGLRTAALIDTASRRTWLERLDQLPTPGSHQARLLNGIARAMATEEPGAALAILAALPDPTYVAGLDRLQLGLLRAQLTFSDHGWPAAATVWDAFEMLQPRRHLDGLLRLQLARTPALLAAVPQSALVRRLAEGVVAPAAAAGAWQLEALGGFRLTHDGATCDSGVRPIDQLLLVRLVEAGPTGLPVLKLWGDVWGDRDYSSDALRQALSRLRRATELPVQMRNGHCLLRVEWSSLSYDVARFEAPFSGPVEDLRVLEVVRAMYRGPFLCHLHYESAWLESRRESLHRHALLVAERLASAYEDVDPQQALQLHSEILSHDPCRELAIAGAMRCYAQLGQRAQAIVVYQQARRALDAELGLEPSSLIEQLYHDLM